MRHQNVIWFQLEKENNFLQSYKPRDLHFFAELVQSNSSGSKINFTSFPVYLELGKNYQDRLGFGII